jgi:hypothetical protein
MENRQKLLKKYNTEEYYNLFTKNHFLQKKLKESGWQGLSLNDWHRIELKSIRNYNATEGWPNSLNFTDIVFLFYAKLICSEKDLVYVAQVCDICGSPAWVEHTTTFAKKCIKYAKSLPARIMALHYMDYKEFYNVKMLERFVYDTLKLISKESDMNSVSVEWKKFVDKDFDSDLYIQHTHVNDMWSMWAKCIDIAKEYGFLKKFKNEVLALFLRVYATAPNLMSLYSKDNAAQRKIEENDVRLALVKSMMIPFIEETMDVFDTWKQLYFWDYALATHKEQALKQMAYFAKTEAEYQVLVSVAPDNSLIQEHALKGVRELRKIA